MQPLHLFSFYCFFCKSSQWGRGGVKICERPFIPCSTVQLTQWIEMESEVAWRTSQPVFDLAGQQLQDVDLHKYKSSTLAGISGVERRGRTKRAGSGMWFWGVKKQLFEDCKSFHDVGPVCSIMMTLHPITPEWGTQTVIPYHLEAGFQCVMRGPLSGRHGNRHVKQEVTLIPGHTTNTLTLTLLNLITKYSLSIKCVNMILVKNI